MEEKRTIITGVVAHVDHGKTTLIDSLIATQGRISKSLAGDLRYMDSRTDEQERGITLKLSAITLKNNETEHVIIDTPGHADFEFLVENNSVLSDCFLILIDAIEGITPRTYSLINYISHESTVLVINKIDKIDDDSMAFTVISDIIKFANAMIGEDIFVWEHNNVILSCATMCYGINYHQSIKLIGKDRSSLKGTIQFINYLNNKILANDVDKICEKFKVKIKNQKNILSTVMPLGDVVFDSIESIYSQEKLFKNILLQKTPLRLNENVFDEGTVLFVSLAILKDPKIYTKDNMLFMSRLFKGKISVGDILYNLNEEVVIEGLYLFEIGKYRSVETVCGSKLILVKGKFKKNTLICSAKNKKYEYVEKLTPFYKTKLILKDTDTLDDLKLILRVVINTEQCLKLKINKFNEVEVLASGKVQVEKLLEDIKNSEIEVMTSDFDLVFCEYASKCVKNEYEYDNYKLNITVNKRQDEDKGDIDIYNNCFNIKNIEDLGLIQSVLNVFVSSGPIIRENIRETYFDIEIIKKEQNDDSDDLFRIIMKSLKDIFLLSSPLISPFFYKSDISVQKDYLGQAYNGIQRFKHIIIEEDYDYNTAIYTISIFIPHFTYEKFIEEINIRTKGTAYIKTIEHGFLFDLDFSEYVDVIKKAKGLLTSEKIVENPENQRTLKK